MLDERWSADVEEVGSALRRMLSAESSSERVRLAEAEHQGRDPALTDRLREFGLFDLDAAPDMFARIAFELGRALAATDYVETIPALAILRRPSISFGFYGVVPATVPYVAVASRDGVVVEALRGEPQRTTAGDFVVRHDSDNSGERVGGPDVADRLDRFAAVTDAARMVGAGQALLAYGAEYAGQREQFGKIIGAYQGVAHRLARAAGELDAAELLVRKAAFTASPDAEGDGAPSLPFALMVRARAIEAARFVSTNVHQVLGGNGFAMEYDVQLYSRRLRSWAMRGPRPSDQYRELARMMLDPQQRANVRLLWHYERGMDLPRWAREADSLQDRKLQLGRAPADAPAGRGG